MVIAPLSVYAPCTALLHIKVKFAIFRVLDHLEAVINPARSGAAAAAFLDGASQLDDRKGNA